MNIIAILTLILWCGIAVIAKYAGHKKIYNAIRILILVCGSCYLLGTCSYKANAQYSTREYTCDTSKTQPSWFSTTLADSALTLTKQHVIYDGSYVKIDYPNGDVAPDRGVCTDVIIRAYRLVGIDLQSSVHSDMLVHFNKYPKNWAETRANSNIDHRRVPNLMTFFERFGATKEITRNGKDYIPGDIVCWKLGRSQTHIGIVSNVLSEDKQRYLIIHNIGAGQVLEDCLFSFKIIGHYTYRYKFL